MINQSHITLPNFLFPNCHHVNSQSSRSLPIFHPTTRRQKKWKTNCPLQAGRLRQDPTLIASQNLNHLIIRAVIRRDRRSQIHLSDARFLGGRLLRLWTVVVESNQSPNSPSLHAGLSSFETRIHTHRIRIGYGTKQNNQKKGSHEIHLREGLGSGSHNRDIFSSSSGLYNSSPVTEDFY